MGQNSSWVVDSTKPAHKRKPVNYRGIPEAFPNHLDDLSLLWGHHPLNAASMRELAKRTASEILEMDHHTSDGYLWPIGFHFKNIDPGVFVLFPDLHYCPLLSINVDRPVAVFANAETANNLIVSYYTNHLLRHYRAVVRELRDK